jgi:hypothetical protein
MTSHSTTPVSAGRHLTTRGESPTRRAPPRDRPTLLSAERWRAGPAGSHQRRPPPKSPAPIPSSASSNLESRMVGDDQHGARWIVQQTLAHASENRTRPWAATARAHDDQVGLAVDRGGVKCTGRTLQSSRDPNYRADVGSERLDRMFGRVQNLGQSKTDRRAGILPKVTSGTAEGPNPTFAGYVRLPRRRPSWGSPDAPTPAQHRPSDELPSPSVVKRWARPDRRTWPMPPSRCGSVTAGGLLRGNTSMTHDRTDSDEGDPM